MNLRLWSERLDRRAQDKWRRPFVAPVYFGGALAFLLYGLLVAGSPAVPLTAAAVWFVLAIVSVVARVRDRR